MANQKLFGRKTKGKKSPTRSARLMLKRLRSWQQYHAPDPIKNKLPILLISGYMFTLIITLVFIGLILDLIIIQFENQLKTEGFTGFARLHSTNKSLYSGSLANLLKINLIELSVDQRNFITSLPPKLESMRKSLENSQQLFHNLFNSQNNISKKAKESLAAFKKWNETYDKLSPQVDKKSSILNEVSKIIYNQSVLNDLIYNTLLPVNSYQLQCGRFGQQFRRPNSTWKLIKFNEPKLLLLGSTNLSTELNLFEIIDKLNINLSHSNEANFRLSPRSITSSVDGYAVKLKTKGKLKYSPVTIKCGLWLRTK